MKKLLNKNNIHDIKSKKLNEQKKTNYEIIFIF